MEDVLDHFQKASGDPMAVVCTTCHSKFSKNSRESVLQKHLKTGKHMKALSKLRREASVSSAKKPKLPTQEKTGIFQLKMEDLIMRFPHLAEKIFDSLENKSLTTCQEVSKSWNNFVCKKKFFLIRVIEGEVEYFHALGDDWKKIFDKGTTETIADLRNGVGQFYGKGNGLEYHEGLTPSHVAAGTGKLELLKSIEKITGRQENLKDGEGWTLMHYAAQNGYLNVLEYVMALVDDKNPESESEMEYLCTTPLQLAANNDKQKICEYMLENIKDILTPKTLANWDFSFDNPFNVAAKIGNLKLCKRILENIANEDLRDFKRYCIDACFKASLKGHWKVVKLIANYCEKKIENDD